VRIPRGTAAVIGKHGSTPGDGQCATGRYAGKAGPMRRSVSQKTCMNEHSSQSTAMDAVRSKWEAEKAVCKGRFFHDYSRMASNRKGET